MKLYLDNTNGTKEFKSKSPNIQQLINEALYIIETLGIPILGLGVRRQEKMALAFLSVLDVTNLNQWNNIKDLETPRVMKTRDIIQYENTNFGENISMGSYDDIRRKDLVLLVLANLILPTSPESATNDSRRGYALNPEYSAIIKEFGTVDWDEQAKSFMKDKITLQAELQKERVLKKIPVSLPGGLSLSFSQGDHNVLQKAIIEEFLPRYGYGAEVLYVGDTADKFLHLEESKLKDLKFFEISHGNLPDILAYSPSKNWLYLIEAVHSSGPISPERMYELKKLTKDCTAEIIFITAFLTRDIFRRFMTEIAWETEVWIAGEADHLIHFNGDKFMGPYSS